jgi:RimJ/RimL family protein N-acetyltransferase
MELRERLTEVWPLFGLRVRTPRLELRYADDGDLLDLADLSGDIHEPEARPFAVPWNLAPTDLERRQGVLRFSWARRGTTSAASWSLTLVTVVDDEVVGMQGIAAEDFPVSRTVGSGSWLNRAHQGKGIGTEMRAAMLHLAFAGLGAVRAESGAFEDNAVSIAVSRRNGYRDNGDKLIVEGSTLRREVLFVMDRSDWEAVRRDDIEVIGLEPCLPFLGLGDAEGAALA